MTFNSSCGMKVKALSSHGLWMRDCTCSRPRFTCSRAFLARLQLVAVHFTCTSAYHSSRRSDEGFVLNLCHKAFLTLRLETVLIRTHMHSPWMLCRRRKKRFIVKVNTKQSSLVQILYHFPLRLHNIPLSFVALLPLG